MIITEKYSWAPDPLKNHKRILNNMKFFYLLFVIITLNFVLSQEPVQK